jgi:GNAT superfamily N-acetyltransferase
MEPAGSQPNIRLARPDDVPRLTALCVQLGYPATQEAVQLQLDDLMSDADHVVYVAEAPGGEVVGWVHAFVRRLLIVGPHAEIGGLVVDEEHRGRGTGRLLMQEAEGWAREQGCQAIYLRSNIVRQGAHRFYKQIGYSNIKTSLTFRKEL